MKTKVILILLCLLVVIGGGCDSTPMLPTYTDYVGEMPAWFDSYATKVAQGYAFFNTSGKGLYHVQTVIDYFSGNSNAPSFVGIISIGEEGEPTIYEIMYEDGKYTLHITYSEQYEINGVWTDTYENEYDHVALIEGEIEGWGCVLYNGEKPSFKTYEAEDWMPENAIPVCSILP